MLLLITEIIIASASTKNSSTLATLNPSAGIIFSVSTALLTFIATQSRMNIYENCKYGTLNYEIGYLEILCNMRRL